MIQAHGARTSTEVTMTRHPFRLDDGRRIIVEVVVCSEAAWQRHPCSRSPFWSVEASRDLVRAVRLVAGDGRPVGDSDRLRVVDPREN